MIRVLIADDHTMVRSSLALFLRNSEGIELVGEAADGEEAVLLCQQHKPDVILMDMMMPRMNGVEASKRILASNPDVYIIALTSFVEDNLVYDALDAGATSYVLKNASLQDLLQTIKDTVSGKPTLAPEAAKALIQSTRQNHIQPGHLSPRELEVLAEMVEGNTNRQISQSLDLSLSTVKFHVSSILSKLSASSRTEAVSIALQNKLLD